jgi:alpha-tubulin suppressor-like RCC1 family protein
MKISKALNLILLTGMFLQMVAGIPQTAIAAEPAPPAVEPTPPADAPIDEGPLNGIEGETNPLYPALTGDHPQDPDWYELPPSAFLPPESNLPAAGVTQVAGGLGHTCALTTSGGVKCWGDNWEGKLGNGSIVDSFTPVDVSGLTSGVVAISSSHKHTCALTEAGGMKCWGRNWHGELGDNSTEYRVTPVDVVGLTSGVKGITAGGFHTCALLTNGGIKCWGANWHGQVGDDSKEQRYLPVDVVGLDAPAVQVAAGKYHTCALLETGGVQCWGYNLYGQLGNDSQEDRPVAQDVTWLGSGVQAITAGENHTCALTYAGEVLCWGNNDEGQLGIGNTDMQLIPAFVNALGEGNLSIQAGMRFTCAQAADGKVKCWGENWAGQLGDGTQSGQLTPVNAIGLPANIAGIGTGDSHTCVVLATQGLMCWGSNSYGQIGNGESAIRSQPVDVVGLTNGIQAIVSGGLHSCALTSGGAVLCWGNNKYGQLGNDTRIDSVIPVNVVGLDHDVTAITAGGFHTCATYREEVRCWGYNEFGQVGDGSRVDRQTPQTVSGVARAALVLAAGSNHTCALLSESQVLKCWGQNKNGQLGNGTKVDSAGAVYVEGVEGLRFASLTAGDRHTCASTLNGNVLCWGFNQYGQLGDGTNEISTLPVEVLNIDKEIAVVTAGFYHTCGLTFDGIVNCWGDNTYGQLGDGSTTQQWTPVLTNGLGSTVLNIAAGSFHTCAVLADQSAMCWGINQDGQLGNGNTFMQLLPVQVTGLGAAVVQLEAGAMTTCGLTDNGGAKCWGSHANGQAGDGSAPWVLSPYEVNGLINPILTINYPDGQPGSFFTVQGEDLPGNISVQVKVNNVLLAPELTTDSEGMVTFYLDSSLAEAGSYVVTVIAGKGYNLSFRLDDNAPYHAQEGSGVVYQIPGSIAMTFSAFLPFSFK